jgi:hypothetical protein
LESSPGLAEVLAALVAPVVPVALVVVQELEVRVKGSDAGSCKAGRPCSAADGTSHRCCR